MGARVFRPALHGQAVNVVGNIKLPHTYGYVPDIARGLVVLGQRDEALGEVWHLPGPETVTTREFLTMVFAESGHRTKVRRAGKPLLRFLGFFNPQVRELVEMMYQFQEPFVVEHTKFVDAFGDISTPLTEAVRATVEWYREQEPAAPQGPAEGEEDAAEAEEDAAEAIDDSEEPIEEEVDPDDLEDSDEPRADAADQDHEESVDADADEVDADDAEAPLASEDTTPAATDQKSIE